MSLINIRKYKPQDHKDVNRIFAKSLTDLQHCKDGVLIGWQNPCVISYITIMFFMGLLYSISYGIIALLIGIGLHGLFVFANYHFYVW